MRFELKQCECKHVFKPLIHIANFLFMRICTKCGELNLTETNEDFGIGQTN